MGFSRLAKNLLTKTSNTFLWSIFLPLIVLTFIGPFVSAEEKKAQQSQPQQSQPPRSKDESPIEATTPPVKPPQKTVWVAHILRRKTSDLLIKNLEFPDNRVPVFLVAKDEGLRPTVSIHGKFDRPGWKLVLQDNIPVSFDATPGEFTIYAHLRSRISEVLLTAVGPAGEKEIEHVYVYAPEAMEFQVVSAWDQILLSAGVSFLSYAQAGFGEYQSISGLLSARYSSPENWKSRFGLLASGDVTVFTAASSPVDRGPQILEGKLDISFLLKPDPTKRWRSQIFAGGSYLTMLSYGSPFGFSDLIAPEFGMRSRYTVNPQAAWIGEARFVALAPPGSFDQLGCNLSIAWSKFVSDSHRLELGFQYTGYIYEPEPSVAIHLHQFALKLGLSI
jgi:hypothetical protein